MAAGLHADSPASSEAATRPAETACSPKLEILSTLDELAIADAGGDWQVNSTGELLLQLGSKKYQLTKTLGAGGSSMVYAAHCGDGEEIALKACCLENMSAQARQRMMQEEELWPFLKHKNIVKHIHRSVVGEVLYTEMELVAGGELFDVIVNNTNKVQRYTEKDAARVTRQLLLAVDHIHAKSIVHRDIKPDNILCTSNNIGECQIKLADFGLGRRLPPPQAPGTPCGTDVYQAPETKEGLVSAACDMWSVGCVVYVLLCGMLPFGSTDMAKLNSLCFPSEQWSHVSEQGIQFVKQLLQVDARQRPLAAEALEMAWLRQAPPTPLSTPSQLGLLRAQLSDQHLKECFKNWNRGIEGLSWQQYKANFTKALANATSASSSTFTTPLLSTPFATQLTIEHAEIASPCSSEEGGSSSSSSFKKQKPNRQSEPQPQPSGPHGEHGMRETFETPNEDSRMSSEAFSRPPSTASSSSLQSKFQRRKNVKVVYGTSLLTQCSSPAASSPAGSSPVTEADEALAYPNNS